MDNIKIEDIHPVGARILLQIDEMESETKSGLIISDSATNNSPVTGVVTRSGEKSLYKTGERVMFRRYSVDLLKIVGPTGEIEFYFIDDTDVLATVGAKEKANEDAQINLRKEIKQVDLQK